MDADELNRIVKQRGTLRGLATRDLNDLDTAFENVDEANLLRANRILSRLKQHLAELKDMDEAILANVKPDQHDAEITKVYDYRYKLTDGIADLELKLKQYEVTEARRNAPQQQVINGGGAGAADTGFRHERVPEMELTEFNGNPLDWEPFWDDFRQSCDARQDLSAITKFKLLRKCLTGPAANTFKNYQLTVENYEVVKQILEERYGDKETAVALHLEALVKLKPASSHAVLELIRVRDECEAHIRALVILGFKEDTFGQLFAPILLSKLPKFVRLDIRKQKKQSGQTTWSMDKLRETLSTEIELRSTNEHEFFGSDSESSRDQGKHQRNRGTEGKFVSTSSTLHVASGDRGQPRARIDAPTRPCIFCDAMHFSGECDKYTDVESRQARLPANSCYLCLREGHRKADCRSKARSCYHCKRQGHHSSLCLTKFGSANAAADNTAAHVNSSPRLNPEAHAFAPDNVHAVNTITADHPLRPRRGLAILASATVTVVGETNSCSARIIFDDGSTKSYISERLVRKIGARSTGYELTAVGRFGETTRQTQQLETCEFSIVLHDGNHAKMEMNVQKIIAPNPMLYPLDLDQVMQFCKVDDLAEVIVSKPTEVKIDILLGLDYYYTFVGAGEFRCPNGLVLKETKVGYVVTGFKLSPDINLAVAQQMLVIGDQQRDPFDLQKFWRLEDIGITDDPGVTDDEAALQHFNATTKVVDGRYSVQWPFMTEKPNLPSNYGIALRRLNSVLRKLKGDPTLLEAYNENFNSQKAKGVIEEAPEEPDGIVHHLCHHGVLTPHKTTTKLRVVFDASARPNHLSLSLNEAMYRGPVFLNDLCGILLRFRLSPIVILSDVEKAFLQILLQLAYRDCTRFLWLKDFTKPATPDNIIIYRYARVLFGAKASPFLLAATIMHHMTRIGGATAEDIMNNTYVDNVFSGQRSTEDALRYYEEAKSLFGQISMNLREWYSNDRHFIASIAEPDRGTDSTPSVLGLKWSIDPDRVSVTTGKLQSFGVVTKRAILKSIASVYDPCGWFGPVTIRGKMTMQDLWSEKRGWDDAVSEEILQTWTQLAADLRQLSTFTLQRYIGADPDTQGEGDLQLHCFCDASGKAFGAAVYLRVDTAEETKCSLLFAKSRVTPLKKQLTIPKLELVACTVGALLLDFVSKESGLKLSRKVLWSDSSCVLSWIHSKELTTVFVSNRVKRIRAIPDLEFRHVPTEFNPADLISRGTNAESLMLSKKWWNGPSWLLRDSGEWPEMEIRVKSAKPEEPDLDDDLEVHDLCALTTSTPPEEALFDVKRFSSVRKLYGVTCRVMRALCVFAPEFVAKKYPQFHATHWDKRLTVKELANARGFWDKRVQRQYFAYAYELETKQSRPWKSFQKQLGLFLHDDGLLRSRGRFKHATDLTSEHKYPILLPKKNRYTSLIVKDYHERTIHMGPQATLAAVRCQYWIPQARNVVKQVLKDCRLCRRHGIGPFRIPEPPPLPSFRCSIQRPFACAGLDYLGPLIIREGETQKKVWVAIFTCAAIRAIHLDTVSSLNTVDFLLCLRRFIATYGKPDIIVSDNAKQFRMADSVLKKLWLEVVSSDDVQSYAVSQAIEWKFITELSPWMGGFYERMIRPVKEALRKSIGPRAIDRDELQTLLTEIAAVVNDRPLLYQGTEPNEQVLTPNHLMFRARELFPEVEDNDDYREKTTKADDVIAHWKQGQKVLRRFWDSWKTQYLVSLRERPVKHQQRATAEEFPTVGMTVLVKDNLPRGMWRFGRLESLLPSSDGQVRSAKVKLANGHVLARPLKLLCPLELAAEPQPQSESRQDAEAPINPTRPRRRAAEVSAQLTKQQLQA